jgi:transcriptional regulator with XRE-family HTH domain
MDHVLGRKLRLARTEAGLSQQALAERLGITFQQIQKYEKGANRIAASRLVNIAAAVDQPISYFLESAKEPAGARPASKGGADVWSSPEHMSLAQFFASIESPKVRRRVVELVRAIVEADEARRAAPAGRVKRKSAKRAAPRGRR